MAQLSMDQVGIQKKQVVALDITVQVARPMDCPDGLQYFFEDSECRIGRREAAGAQGIASAAGNWLFCTIRKNLVQKQPPAVLLLHHKKQRDLRVKISRRGFITDPASGDLIYRGKVKNPHRVAGAVAHLLADLFFPLEISPGLLQQDVSLFRAAARRLYSTVLPGPGDTLGGIPCGGKTLFQHIPDGAALSLSRVDNAAAADANFACKDGIDLLTGGDNAITRVENLFFAFICFINIHCNPSSCCFMLM